MRYMKDAYKIIKFYYKPTKSYDFAVGQLSSLLQFAGNKNSVPEEFIDKVGDHNANLIFNAIVELKTIDDDFLRSLKYPIYLPVSFSFYKEHKSWETLIIVGSLVHCFYDELKNFQSFFTNDAYKVKELIMHLVNGGKISDDVLYYAANTISRI